MLGKAKETVGPPWALVSRQKVPRDLGEGLMVTERERGIDQWAPLH